MGGQQVGQGKEAKQGCGLVQIPRGAWYTPGSIVSVSLRQQAGLADSISVIVGHWPFR